MGNREPLLRLLAKQILDDMEREAAASAVAVPVDREHNPPLASREVQMSEPEA